MREWSKDIYHKISAPCVRFCILNKITANHITVFNHFITLTLGCYLFSLGWHWALICGLIVCLINGFLDYLDGDVAKSSNNSSRLGIWLDSGFDVILQNAVMASIGVGCYKMGMPFLWVVVFLISNSAVNFVSFNYNSTFGFDSDSGSEVFRRFMDKRCHFINRVLKNLIDPTDNYFSLMFYTFRYWIAFGALFNLMIPCFVIMTLINTVKWVVMYAMFALYLMGEKRLYVLRVLSFLDEERSEFYSLRNSQ